MIGRRLAEPDARIERLTRLRDGPADRIDEPLRALARATHDQAATSRGP